MHYASILMLLVTYHALNYAGIIGLDLQPVCKCDTYAKEYYNLHIVAKSSGVSLVSMETPKSGVNESLI